MKFNTKAVHSGNKRDESTGAIVAPVHFASTFVQKNAGEMGEFDYSRSGNPTRKSLETTIASLENGNHALCFSTGMASIHCVSMLLKTGDHILAGSDIYGGTYRLFHKIINNSGISVSLANSTDISQFEKAITPNTKLIWIESPGNPLMSISDIKAIADIAKKHNILLAVDSTFATSVFTKPLDYGADIVMHSATKFFGGHSDMSGGALIVKDKNLFDKLYYIQNATGAVMSSMDAFLCQRGIKTLGLRVKEQSESASKIAHYLIEKNEVAQVFYPGLKTHNNHEVAKKQMSGGFGSILSFELKMGFEAAKLFSNSTQFFQLAVSVGAVESIIEQPASMSHASYDREDRLKHGISDGLIRLSVGIENSDDLISDLERGFIAINKLDSKKEENPINNIYSSNYINGADASFKSK